MFDFEAFQPAVPAQFVDRDEVTAANALIARYGGHAAGAAQQRAEQSRAVGNYVHFCRWRQVERLIDFLAAGRGGGTVH